MYAIVEIGSSQFKVEENKYIYAPFMEGGEGSSVVFDKVLLVDKNGQINVGTPLLNGGKVNGKIVEHVRGDKVIVFKKKRRKDYKKTIGHRQKYTKVLIEKISA